jgi:hypothetical protein
MRLANPKSQPARLSVDTGASRKWGDIWKGSPYRFESDQIVRLLAGRLSFYMPAERAHALDDPLDLF